MKTQSIRDLREGDHFSFVEKRRVYVFLGKDVNNSYKYHPLSDRDKIQSTRNGERGVILRKPG